jgi:hypothetical protein
MAKRAFCVGINDYPFEGNDLRGCVNDAKAWRDLLVDEFAFPAENVKLLTDQEATRQAMFEGVKGLVEGASEGDVLVFTNSSHGSQIADTSGDEETYDEVLCPYDSNEQLLTDDDLRELLDKLPAGVSMTVISDSCHSGSGTRDASRLLSLLPEQFRPRDGRRPRYLNPRLLANAARNAPALADSLGAPPRGRVAYPESGMNHVLLSGCLDSEVSWDANIEGTPHGAMSYHTIKAIRDAGATITYAELADLVQPLLDAAGYVQHPQTEGPDELKQRQLFT